MSDAAHWQYGGGATGQPVPMQDGEIDLAACTPPLFGQMNAQGRGVPKVIQVQQPAAGADWKYVHSGPSWFIPTCIVSKFVTSGVAANRQPQITITFRSVLCAQFAAAIAIVASTTVIVSASDAGSSSASAATLMLGLADNIMIADGMTLGSFTTNIDVGDQYSAIAILCEEFSEFDWS